MPQLETVSARLDHLEQVIERGRQSFIDVGWALLEIRDKRLYLPAFPSFDAYCGDRWGFEKSLAGKLIRGARAVAELGGSHVTQLPGNARQAAELARAPEGERAEVWQKVVENGEPTAAKVRDVVEQKSQRQQPSAEETFRGMLTSAVSYGAVVAELDPATIRAMFEAALRDALRDLADMA